MANKSATYGQSIPIISGPDRVRNNGADDLKTFGLFAVYVWEAPTKTERIKRHKINILEEPMTLNQRVLGSSPKKSASTIFPLEIDGTLIDRTVSPATKWASHPIVSVIGRIADR
ncbi:hypothetical protein GCM10009115_15440 [Sphingopyxis soli]|uniref:Uncharacterized protein n=2 Tax=Sphingopyxis TaxID=165697 RepID=A0A0N7GSS8_SPHMC|nr:hypothetical protein AN936_14690 [Sphingopyxis macrogoltabida]